MTLAVINGLQEVAKGRFQEKSRRMQLFIKNPSQSSLEDPSNAIMDPLMECRLQRRVLTKFVKSANGLLQIGGASTQISGADGKCVSIPVGPGVFLEDTKPVVGAKPVKKGAWKHGINESVLPEKLQEIIEPLKDFLCNSPETTFVGGTSIIKLAKRLSPGVQLGVEFSQPLQSWIHAIDEKTKDGFRSSELLLEQYVTSWILRHILRVIQQCISSRGENRTSRFQLVAVDSAETQDPEKCQISATNRVFSWPAGPLMELLDGTDPRKEKLLRNEPFMVWM
jgi:hypothetical protein